MPEFRAGYGDSIITPPLGVELTGYGYYRERRAETVLHDLKTRAIAVTDGRARLVLVSCDLLGFTVETADALRDRIAAEAGTSRSHVLLSCTHTHTGPATLSLEGLGEVDEDYLAGLGDRIVEAARLAVGDERDASLSYALEPIAPIGHNRRIGGFAPIDPVLKVAVFARDDRKIYLLNYACHPVTFGAATGISPDWPGAAARALEDRGHAAAVFQGFCGDINPVSTIKHWGQGSTEDVAFYGQLLAGEAVRAERYATREDAPVLAAIERRIALPLRIPSEAEIDAVVAEAQASDWPGLGRFTEAWAQRAKAARPALLPRPALPDVPVQALAIGEMTLLALPGEVFCDYALSLRERHPALFPIGYANGNVGYLPTRDAYADPQDYACHAAPRFYATFPFTPDLDDVVLAAASTALEQVQ